MTKFNAFTYAESLKQAGVSEQQARVHAAEFMALMQELASKEDLKREMEYLNTVFSVKISFVETMLKWLLTFVGLTGVLLAFLNFLHWYC